MSKCEFLLSFASLRFASLRFAPLRSASLRFAPLRSACWALSFCFAKSKLGVVFLLRKKLAVGTLLAFLLWQLCYIILIIVQALRVRFAFHYNVVYVKCQSFAQALCLVSLGSMESYTSCARIIARLLLWGNLLPATLPLRGKSPTLVVGQTWNREKHYVALLCQSAVTAQSGAGYCPLRAVRLHRRLSTIARPLRGRSAHPPPLRAVGVN